LIAPPSVFYDFSGSFVNEPGEAFIPSGTSSLNLVGGTTVTNRGWWEFAANGGLLSTSATFTNKASATIIKTGGTGTTRIDQDIQVDTPGLVEAGVGLLRIGGAVPQVVSGTTLTGGT
jgi:hypothetical protein